MPYGCIEKSLPILLSIPISAVACQEMGTGGVFSDTTHSGSTRNVNELNDSLRIKANSVNKSIHSRTGNVASE